MGLDDKECDSERLLLMYMWFVKPTTKKRIKQLFMYQ